MKNKILLSTLLSSVMLISVSQQNGIVLNNVQITSESNNKIEDLYIDVNNLGTWTLPNDLGEFELQRDNNKNYYLNSDDIEFRYVFENNNSSMTNFNSFAKLDNVSYSSSGKFYIPFTTTNNNDGRLKILCSTNDGKLFNLNILFSDIDSKEQRMNYEFKNNSLILNQENQKSLFHNLQFRTYFDLSDILNNGNETFLEINLETNISDSVKKVMGYDSDTYTMSNQTFNWWKQSVSYKVNDIKEFFVGSILTSLFNTNSYGTSLKTPDYFNIISTDETEESLDQSWNLISNYIFGEEHSNSFQLDDDKKYYDYKYSLLDSENPDLSTTYKNINYAVDFKALDSYDESQVDQVQKDRKEILSISYNNLLDKIKNDDSVMLELEKNTSVFALQYGDSKPGDWSSDKPSSEILIDTKANSNFDKNGLTTQFIYLISISSIMIIIPVVLIFTNRKKGAKNE